MNFITLIGILCSCLSPILLYYSSKIESPQIMKSVLYITSYLLMSASIKLLMPTTLAIIAWIAFIIFVILLVSKFLNKQSKTK